jgi:hypothetical protein
LNIGQKRVLSEEKNHKTFDSSRGFRDPGQIPYREAGAGHKSLLVLFFRKEHAS